MTQVNIAMWSGPRNISTAMMRSFENRTDTRVWDEPLYGPYLAETGLPHPMAAAVIEEQGVDWQPILKACASKEPREAKVLYQKHMTHHLLPQMPLEWLDSLVNCFLIRRPDEVLASYHNKREGDTITAMDLGFPQQTRIYEYLVERTGRSPVVLDSADVLKDPEGILRQLCDRTGIEFQDNMLAWPAGRRDSDGVWSEHWYDAVWKSTEFAPWRERDTRVPAHLTQVLDDCLPHYERLVSHKLQLG